MIFWGWFTRWVYHVVKLLDKWENNLSRSEIWLRRFIHNKKIFSIWSLHHQNLLSQIFSVTTGVYNDQISLQYMLHRISAQAVANLSISIQLLLKNVQLFSWETITHKICWLLIRHALPLQSLISLFLKVYLSIYLRNLGSRRCLIWQ